jgi:type IV secretory pathway protease TraF
MLALAVLAILYDNVDLVRGWVVIDGVLGARTLKDIEEGRCLSEIISGQGREPK